MLKFFRIYCMQMSLKKINIKANITQELKIRKIYKNIFKELQEFLMKKRLINFAIKKIKTIVLLQYCNNSRMIIIRKFRKLLICLAKFKQKFNKKKKFIFFICIIIIILLNYKMCFLMNYFWIFLLELLLKEICMQLWITKIMHLRKFRLINLSKIAWQGKLI